jgi:hypothetical protein
MFLRDWFCEIIEIKTVTSGTLLTPIYNREQQESQDKEIINMGESQMYKVESEFSEMPLLKYMILL